jgi:hypothetical protein
MVPESGFARWPVSLTNYRSARFEMVISTRKFWFNVSFLFRRDSLSVYGKILKAKVSEFWHFV